MKKTFLQSVLLVAILSFGFVACSKDDEDNNDNSSSLEFIQVRVYSEDVTAPEGNVYLFYVENYINEIDNMHPFTRLEWTPMISYTSRVDGKSSYMSPVSKYGTKSKGRLGVYPDKNYSVTSIGWSDLSSYYGTPKAGGRYVLYVALDDDILLKSSKELTISKNSIVEVHFPKASKKYDSRWVEAEFIVKDYK